MSDITALEVHLRAHPDDWDSWLVYADWLTELYRIPSARARDSRGQMSHDTPHDSLFRFTFSRSEQALDHFRAHLPQAVVEAVRWETLALQPGSFVDEDLQQLHSDILYRVALQGTEPRELFLYVLLEHQSQPDRLMPFRLLRYMVRIWERALSQQGHRLPLPFIVPMVLYHGAPRWTVPLDFHGLFPDSLPPEQSTPLLAHVPQFRLGAAPLV